MPGSRFLGETAGGSPAAVVNADPDASNPAGPGDGSITALSDTALITKVQSLPPGDRQRQAASEELVRRYQWLVQSCASRYRHSPEPWEDLLQVGYVGLLSAVNRFDVMFGTAFATYARPCVTGEIKRHFRDKRWQVRVRRTAQELRAEVRKCEAELTHQLSRPPTEQEVAEHLGLKVSEVREGREADRAFQSLSLDAPLSAEADAATLAHLLGDNDETVATLVDMEAVWAHIGELPDREQAILTMRFYGNMTQAQVGDQLGISQMHVSRLLTHALRYLKDKLAA